MGVINYSLTISPALVFGGKDRALPFDLFWHVFLKFIKTMTFRLTFFRIYAIDYI